MPGNVPTQIPESRRDATLRSPASAKHIRSRCLPWQTGGSGNPRGPFEEPGRADHHAKFHAKADPALLKMVREHVGVFLEIR